MDQLSLLDWQPPPELMQPRECEPAPNPHAIAWWEGGYRYYTESQTRLIHLQIAEGVKPHRTHEITRLQRLRAECAKKLKTLRGH